MALITKRTEFPIRETSDPIAKGAALYTRSTLALYDLAVLGFSNAFVWRCPSRVLLDLYNEHVSNSHLDVGVGTGYFLDKCRFPSQAPSIALFDLNSSCLYKTAHRLRRYAPSCHLGNLLEPVEIGLSGFGSIGLNYVLHCLPGNLLEKSIVFKHLKPLLKDGGVLFGSTILGEGVCRNRAARKLMNIYNAKGIFNNALDSLDDLENGLSTYFDEFEIQVHGCVAVFHATKRVASLKT
jgi:hypothetical protein